MIKDKKLNELDYEEALEKRKRLYENIALTHNKQLKHQLYVHIEKLNKRIQVLKKGRTNNEKNNCICS